MAIAIALRLIYFTGMVRGDAFNYAHAALEMANGRLGFGDWVGQSRIGLYAPVALLYKLFGPGEGTTLFVPLFASLLSIYFLYRIAKFFGGQQSGLIAAILWAFFPLDVHLSTTLLPDAPLTALTLGSAYLLFQFGAEEEAKKRIGYFLLSLFLLIWAILLKPLAIVLLAYFAVFMIGYWKKSRPHIFTSAKDRLLEIPRWALGILGLLVMALMALYFGYQARPFVVSMARNASNLSEFLITGATELDFSDVRFAYADILVFIAPLFLVAFVSLLKSADRALRNLLTWAAVLFLYYEWGTINLNPFVYVPIESFVEARNMLFVLAPLIAIAAVYLGRNIKKSEQANWLLMGVAFAALALAYVLKPSLYAGERPEWLLASFGISYVGAIFLPAILSGIRNNGRVVAVSIFLLSVLLAGVRPVMPYHALMYADRLAMLDAYREAATFFDENPDGLIYAGNPGRAMRLNYASDLELGYAWSANLTYENVRIQDGDPPAMNGEDAYVVKNNWRNEDLNDPAVVKVVEVAPGSGILIYLFEGKQE